MSFIKELKAPCLIFLGDEPEASHAKTGMGIAHWRPELSEEAREEYLRDTADAMGLPCVDPVATGVGPLVDHIIGSFK